MLEQSRTFLSYQWFTSIIVLFVACATKQYYGVIFASILLIDFWLTAYLNKP